MFVFQKELRSINPVLIDSIQLDEAHNVASTQPRVSKLPREQFLQPGQWYLQALPDGFSTEKRCQAAFSKKECKEVLQKGAFLVA